MVTARLKKLYYVQFSVMSKSLLLNLQHEFTGCSFTTKSFQPQINSPFSSIFSKADKALLVLTFPTISFTFVAVLKQHRSDHDQKVQGDKTQTKRKVVMGIVETTLQTVHVLSECLSLTLPLVSCSPKATQNEIQRMLR